MFEINIKLNKIKFLEFMLKQMRIRKESFIKGDEDGWLALYYATVIIYKSIKKKNKEKSKNVRDDDNKPF